MINVTIRLSKKHKNKFAVVNCASGNEIMIFDTKEQAVEFIEDLNFNVVEDC